MKRISLGVLAASLTVAWALPASAAEARGERAIVDAASDVEAATTWNPPVQPDPPPVCEPDPPPDPDPSLDFP